MSYCVNCGVELDSSAKKCALCSTPVINPNDINAYAKEKPFSDTLLIPKGIKKRFIAFVITMTMLIPNIVMFFLNVFFVKEGFWSIYVFSACLLVWVMFVFPLLTKKVYPYILWGFDTLTISGFFFVLFALLQLSPNIYYCVQSVILLVSVAVLADIIWLRKRKRHWTAIVVVLLFEIAVLALLSGIAVGHFSALTDFYVVGFIIAVCSLVMMCFFIYCNRSKHMRAWLNKVFYV